VVLISPEAPEATSETGEQAKAECPSCGAVIPQDAEECPQCGELFATEALEAFEAPEEEVVEEGRRERILFYLGVVLILLGGPGIALGSWLHDWFSIPIIGNAFDAFGWVNRLFAAVGLIVLIVGMVFLILSLRMTKPETEGDYEVGLPK